jgi:TP901 family phage tail tape measure protein
MQAIKIRPLVLDMESLSTKTQIAAQRQALLNQLLKQGSTNLLNFGKNTQWAGRQLMVGFTIPLVMMGAAATKAYTDMETAAVKFKRVYGDTTTSLKETDLMAKKVQGLANAYTKYGVAVSDTMDLAATAAATGKTGEALLQQINNANKLSVLGGVDQQQSLQTTISLTNAFGIATKDLSSNIDFLNAVENQTVLSIEDMTIAIPKAAPVIQQLGGDAKDLAFFLTAMKEGGINASEGANALKSGLAAMINPTNSARKMLSGLGIDIEGIVKKDKGNLKKTVLDFAGALNELDPLARAQAIEQMFGKFQFARISTLFKNVTAQGSQANRVLELSGKTTGELAYMSQQEMKKMEDSPLFKFQKTMADLQASLAPIGEQFMKLLTPVLQVASDMAKGFNSLPDTMKAGIATVVGVVAGLGPVLLMVFGLLANGVANIIKGFSLVKNLFNRTGKSALDLGSQVDYMTQQQIEASAVAASLDQVHGKLKQTFTSEAIAVNELAVAMERSVRAQQAMGGFSRVPGLPPKKYATGGLISGPGTGTSDSILARVSNGEAIIPAKHVARYPGVVNQLVSGNIPGFVKGRGTPEGSQSIHKTASTSGIIAAHGNAPVDMTAEKARSFAETLSPGYVQKNLAGAKENRKKFSNLILGMPAMFNTGQMSGQDASQWIRQQPEAFGSYQQSMRGIDPNSKGMLEFGKHLAEQLAKAGTQAIDDPAFFAAVEVAIDKTKDKEIQKLLKQSASEYGTADVVSTNSGKRRRGAIAGLVSYIRRRDPIRKKYNETAREFEQGLTPGISTSPVIAEEAGKKIVAKVEKDVVDGVNKASDSHSPSVKADKAGKNISDGAIDGIEAGKAEATKAGESLGKAVKTGARRATGGGSMFVPEGTQAMPAGRNRSRRATRPADLTPGELAAIEAENARFNTSGGVGNQAYGPVMGTAKEQRQARSANRIERISGALQNVSREKVMGMGFGLSSAVGLASMAPGPIGNIASQIAGPVMAISTLTSMFPGIISGFGALLPALIPFAPAIGVAVLAIGGITIAMNMAAEAEKKRIKGINALGDAAVLTANQLKTTGDILGIQIKASSIETGKILNNSVLKKADKQSVVSITKNKKWLDENKDTINTLSKSSNAEVKSILEGISLQLSASGGSKKGVANIIAALQEKAGKSNVKLNVNSLDIRSKKTSSIMSNNIGSALQGYAQVYNKNDVLKSQGKGAGSEYERLQAQLVKAQGIRPEDYAKTYAAKNISQANYIKQIREQMIGLTKHKKLLSDINSEMEKQKQYVAGIAATNLKALSSGLDSGIISAKELSTQMSSIRDEFLKIEKTNPGSGISAMRAALFQVNPELAKSLSKVKSIHTMSRLTAATMQGFAPSQKQVDAFVTIEEITKKTAMHIALTRGELTALFAAKLTRKEFYKNLAEYLKALDDAANSTNTVLTAAEKAAAKLQTKIDNLGTALSAFGALEDKINKKYDARAKALDEIQKSNEAITKQQQSQLDLAGALANGDIAAAAKIAQDIRASNAQSSLDEQRTAMDQAKQNEIDNLKIKVGGKYYSKAQLDSMQSAATDKQTATALKKIHFPAKGGLISGYATGGMVNYFANGGFKMGTDTVPAMLTPGEFVVKKAAVDRIGTSKLNSINNGTNSDSSVYNYSISVNVSSGANPNDIANTVIRQIKNIENQRTGSVRY